ncbi:RHS repeat-associated core domain-containing protein [Nitrosomonas sp. H1_AOB3]|uniref:RHS repeat-associated core domain-containing protein n=1 Tax=Nitrosomonas sp. H1_AOB3 TaxID=2741553 RepID=UPI00257E8A37|nr:RHS repeat-associated core domain-containing protein [Nitrosomonas sp. H1_AOB3]
MTLGNSTTTSYAYSTQSALATLTHNLTGTAQDQTYTYTRNQVQEITGQSWTNDSYQWTGYANGTKSYTANGLNQYTAAAGATLTHDTKGNLTGDGVWTYTYDLDNQLICANKTGSTNSLAYDGAGRLRQTTLAGTITGLTYDGVELVAEYNSGGTSTAIHSYGPYGEPNIATGTRFRYTGQQFLGSLNLYYYKARFYSPALGRFLQTDPIGTADDLNLYAYVGNNPINFNDPSGLCPWCVAAGVGAIVGGGIDFGVQLYENGGHLSEVNWVEVGISALAGAGLSALGPTGGLLGRGGQKAVQYGYSESAGLINTGTTRFGWTYNQAKDVDVLSLRIGKPHFDIPGIAATAGANPIRDGIISGVASASIFTPTPAYGVDLSGGRYSINLK